jgi:hypothetical protein
LSDRDGFSRRELVRRGGALALGAGAAVLLPLEKLPLISGEELDGGVVRPKAMRKCISLGGPGPLREDAHPDDYRLWGNREFIKASGTKWVKLWVSWADLQGELDSPPAGRFRSWEHLNGAPSGQSWLRRLDRQVRAVNDDGLGVILTLFHGFPRWSNGASGPDPVSPRKAPEQKLPLDLSIDSPWGWFIGHLCARYKKGAAANPVGPHEPGSAGRPGGEDGYDPQAGNPDGGWVDVLEICNEPNLLYWPQEGIDVAVAQMMRSAERLSSALDGPAILAPATSDFPDQNHETGRGLAATGWRSFTAALLDRLRGFEANVPVYWSQHNFQDVKHGEVPSRAERVVDLLRSEGWITHMLPLWLSEGGYDMYPDQLDARARARQARVIEANFERMKEGRHVYLWTQHTITDKRGNRFKSGLRDDFTAGRGPGARRPSWQVWMRLPGYSRL